HIQSPPSPKTPPASSHHRRVTRAAAMNAAATATIQRRPPCTDRQPASIAKPVVETASPAKICPQNGASSHGGRTDGSGLLQPPGRSSSSVTSVPPSGQPTKKIRNA